MAKKIAILGGGESGVGAAVLAQKKGFEVFLSDKGKIDDKYKKVLSQSEISYEEGKHSAALILDADEIIKRRNVLILRTKRKTRNIYILKTRRRNKWN